jgi:hypothetical protein
MRLLDWALVLPSCLLLPRIPLGSNVTIWVISHLTCNTRAFQTRVSPRCAAVLPHCTAEKLRPARLKGPVEPMAVTCQETCSQTTLSPVSAGVAVDHILAFLGSLRSGFEGPWQGSWWGVRHVAGLHGLEVGVMMLGGHCPAHGSQRALCSFSAKTAALGFRGGGVCSPSLWFTLHTWQI